MFGIRVEEIKSQIIAPDILQKLNKITLDLLQIMTIFTP